jgi:hypothetical protein
MNKSISLLFIVILGASGCGKPEPAKSEPQAADEYQGRDDTKSLRNADAVGYDGAAIQKKLDGALDKNDQRAADLQKQIDAQTGDAPPPDEQ